MNKKFLFGKRAQLKDLGVTDLNDNKNCFVCEKKILNNYKKKKKKEFMFAKVIILDYVLY